MHAIPWRAGQARDTHLLHIQLQPLQYLHTLRQMLRRPVGVHIPARHEGGAVSGNLRPVLAGHVVEHGGQVVQQVQLQPRQVVQPCSGLVAKLHPRGVHL